MIFDGARDWEPPPPVESEPMRDRSRMVGASCNGTCKFAAGNANGEIPRRVLRIAGLALIEATGIAAIVAAVLMAGALL